nr:sigma-70 family RNA polymerase sigma factor [Gammaproteobacteria bacterium]
MPNRPSLPDDMVLVEQLLAGDERAFTQLVRAYHGKLRYLARAIVGEAYADEVVQDTWLAVLKALSGFQARSSLKTWLFRILSNTAISCVRREVRSTAAGGLTNEDVPALPATRFDTSGNWKTPPLPWHAETPEALLASDQLRQCLEETLAVLPASQRMAIVLHDIEGVPMVEVCNILAVQETNARVLLHRARTRLRAVIEAYERGQGC